jgi:hypothetical protein
MDPLKLLFVHIPKTGGISLYSALARVPGLKPAIRFNANTKELRAKFTSMDERELRKHRLISGHFPLRFFLTRPLEDYQVLTVVRSPVDRDLSAYFYLRTAENHPRHEAMKNVSLSAYLNRMEKRRRNNPQCSLLSETGSFEAVKRMIDDGKLLAAPIDYLSQFCDDLSKRWSLGPIKVGRDNSTKVRLAVSEIHPELIRRFEALTPDDAELYRYVKGKFERDVLGR